MALINCPECDREISENAKACPGCGEPVVRKRRVGSDTVFGIVVCVLFTGALAWLFVYGPVSREEWAGLVGLAKSPTPSATTTVTTTREPTVTPTSEPTVTSKPTAEAPVAPAWSPECTATLASLIRWGEAVKKYQEQYHLASLADDQGTAVMKLAMITVALDSMEKELKKADEQCGVSDRTVGIIHEFVTDTRVWLKVRPES